MNNAAMPEQIKEDARLKEVVAVVLEESGGIWHPCSGCHETVDGQETGHYHYNQIFKCYQGSGCHECGGLGVIWDEMREYPSAQPAEQREDKLVIEAMDFYWRHCVKELSRKDLGDIERKELDAIRAQLYSRITKLKS